MLDLPLILCTCATISIAVVPLIYCVQTHVCQIAFDGKKWQQQQTKNYESDIKLTMEVVEVIA